MEKWAMPALVCKPFGIFQKKKNLDKKTNIGVGNRLKQVGNHCASASSEQIFKLLQWLNFRLILAWNLFNWSENSRKKAWNFVTQNL